MRVKQIEYGLTLSYDYNNCHAGVVIELDENDSEVEAMRRAREFVNRQVDKDIIPDWEIKQAREVLAAATKISDEKIKKAEEILAKLEADTLPF